MSTAVFYDADAELAIVQNSRTSQYGQLRAIASDDGAWPRERFTHVLSNDILAGDFVREWSNVQSAGLERLEQLRAQALTSPIAQAEKRLLEAKMQVYW